MFLDSQARRSTMKRVAQYSMIRNLLCVGRTIVSGDEDWTIRRYLSSLCLGMLFVLSAVAASGQAIETILYTFTGFDGEEPYSGLAIDAKGNLYGTTNEGGTGSCPLGCGTVFEVTPAGKEKVVHSF